MKQLQLSTYRRPLEMVDVKSRPITKNEIRLKTAYAGISFTDIIIQKGFYKYQKQHLPLPYTPGFEAVGIVTKVGSTVGGVKVGEKVVVLQRQGCLAEEIIANQKNIIILPSNIDLKWVASLPVNFFTAYHALNNIVTIFPGANILVESAAGGVGGMITELASKQHHVTGLVGAKEKIDYVKSLGAHRVHIYDSAPKGIQFDAIFSASGKNLTTYQKLLSPNGKLIVYGFHSLIPTSIYALPSTIVRYLSLPTIKLAKLVYNNQTIAGFNIINLNQDSPEYKTTKQAFEQELETPTCAKHSITTFPYLEHQKALDLVSDRSHRGKVLLEF